MQALRTAATGMAAQQLLVDNTANNLANLSTTGFKRSEVAFQDLIYLNLLQPGTEQVRQIMSRQKFLMYSPPIFRSCRPSLLTVSEKSSRNESLNCLMTCGIVSGRTTACSCTTNTASSTDPPTLITPTIQLTIRRSEPPCR